MGGQVRQVQVSIDAKKRDEPRYEVTTKFKITSKNREGGQHLFLMELDYSGLFAIEGVRGFSAWHEVDDELRRARAAGAEIVCFSSDLYPARLRMIADPPPVLYVKGKITAADERAVAIVGSRIASDYGRRMARDLARGDLVQIGLHGVPPIRLSMVAVESAADSLWPPVVAVRELLRSVPDFVAGALPTNP